MTLQIRTLLYTQLLGKTCFSLGWCRQMAPEARPTPRQEGRDLLVPLPTQLGSCAGTQLRSNIPQGGVVTPLPVPLPSLPSLWP